MTWAEEARRSIAAVVTLARFDPAGMADLNVSIEGFWRSFGAALLLAPFAALLNALMPPQTSAGAFAIGFVTVVEYVLSWAVFPIAMIFVARFLGLGDRYVAFIVAYNWSTVVQVGLILMITVIGASGIVPVPVAAMLYLAAVAYIFAYLAFVARTALETTWWTAVGLVVLDAVLELFLLAGASAVLPAP